MGPTQDDAHEQAAGGEADVGETGGIKVHDSPFPGSRLMIREMILENFKSYAGVKRIGPFHKCFSAVVGPNGSGKSNVIDAMLFVFGKRAKKLRLNKVSELIHNSTAHPDCEYAKVTVCFQNIKDREFRDEDDDEGFDVVPGSLLEVSRVADRNNKSDYYVDGKKKSFSEVAELLQTRGIDLHNNRFLILQGEVEQISLMKPKAQSPHEEGLLEYLEEIIGSNKYLEAIEEATKSVEELTQSRTEKLGRVKVVEKEKESLEDAKNEAEEFLKKEAQLMQKRSILIQVKLAQAREAQATLLEKREKLAARLKEEEESASAATTESAAIEEAVAALRAEHKELSTALKKSQKEFAEMERKDIMFRENLKDAQAQTKDLEAAVAKLEKARKKHIAAAEKAAQETVPQLEKAAADLLEERKATEAKLEALFESLQGETSNLRADLEAKQKNLAPLSEEVAAAKSKLDVATTEIDLLQEGTRSNKAQLEQARERVQELQAAVASRPQEIKQAETDLKKAERDLDETRAGLEEASRKESDLESKVSAARAKTEGAKAQLAQSAGRGVLLGSLAEAKADKRSPIHRAGLHGRLGDLGSIDPKYDVAVSTACGGLEFLVTDHTRGAEACVEFLRKRNLGRATFAILEKLEHLRAKMDRKIETPEGVPRLFDLVRTRDDRFRPAFYFAMRDTLVAKDLDQAVRIAYKGNKCVWRVVTLQGQVIDTSGTMSGGGRKTKRGAMKLASDASETKAAQRGGQESEEGEDDEIGLVTQDKVDELERNTESLVNELKEVRKEKARLSSERVRLEKLVARLGGMIPKMRLEIDELAKQEQVLHETIADLEPRCELSAEDAARLAKLQKEAGALQKAYDKAHKKLAALEEETSALHQQISDLGGPKEKSFRKRLADIEKALATNRKALTKATNEVSSSEAKAEKAVKAIEEAKAEQEANTTRVAELKAEAKAVEDSALVVLQAFESTKTDEKAKREELDVLLAKLAEHKAKYNKVEKLRVEMRGQLSQYDDHDIPRRQASLDKLEADLKDLQERFAAIAKEREPLAPAPAQAQTTGDADADVMDEDEGESEGDDENVQKKSKHDDDKAPEGEQQNDAAADDDENDDGDEEDGDEDEEATAEAASPSLTMQILSPEQLADLDMDRLAVEIDALMSDVANLKKVVNLSAIQEYRARETEYNSRVNDLDAATKERDGAREACEVLRKKRLTEFMAGFSQITLKLKEMYQMITLGGDAELELVDSCDPFSEGLELSVRPPKKSWKVTANLSGGEKTLSSLALVFALHHYKPTPLYVMDEIDAALDFKNVSIIGNYIKERTRNAQFIVISLRNNMFELADRLVGIYKTHDATKSITINPAKIVRAAKLAAAEAQQKKQQQRKANGKGSGPALEDRPPLAVVETNTQQ
ncbi:Structural maintenance of chromosomes protein 4 [Hondaea fermentalgiana]|uniref:Structural maintenance of chromosomes protein n=1 Tax=Hondaea fermentalgiana TaxID=2315210 RepID=A0A2R5GKU7_9STRA|nr:Structural maintenance of chromosomes protein 4 [Hondaea fermentalgiana]|eukprot:GBG28901.1 Structural maintenance of chromosomes protein 4 [Hondaea fermentalgiana]